MLKIKSIIRASALPLLFAAPITFAADNAELEDLKARIAALESAPSWSSAAMQDEDPLKINGFVNAGVSTSNRDSASGVTGGVGDEANYQAHQSFGLQAGYTIDSKTNVVGQLLGRGYQDNFNVRMNWAYVGRTLTQDKGILSDLKLRMGRMPADIYMISEYYDVGYAYPWVVPPREAYDLLGGVPYDGVDVAANFSLPSNWNLQLKAFAGEVNVQPEAAVEKFDLQKIRGFNAILERDAWRLRAGYGQAIVSYEVCCNNVSSFDTLSGGYNSLEAGYAELVTNIQSIDPSYTPSFETTPITDSGDNLSGSFSGVGLSYDNGTWLVMGEYTLERWDTYNPDMDRAYLSLGRRFGEWMPFVTVSESKIDDDSEALEFAEQVAAMKENLDDPKVQGGILGATTAASTGVTDAEAAIAAGEAVVAAYAAGGAGNILIAQGTCDAIAGVAPGTITDNTQCLSIASGAIAQGQAGLETANEALANLAALNAGLAEFDENADLLSGTFSGLALPRRTYSLGVRYDFAPGATAKFQVDKVTDSDDTGRFEDTYVSHFSIQAAF